MGTHSEGHLTPVKKELLGTRQLLYHYRYEILYCFLIVLIQIGCQKYC